MIKKIKGISLKKGNSPFLKRLVAYFIDWYCISVLTILPINLIYSFTFQQKNFESTIANLPYTQAILAFIIGFFLSALYLIYLPYKNNGQTIGKKLMKLRIVKNHQEKIDFKTLLIRNGVGLILIEGTFFTSSIYFWELMNIVTSTTVSGIALNILGVISILSLAMSLVTANHRMLHDFIAKTSVVAIQK